MADETVTFSINVEKWDEVPEFLRESLPLRVMREMHNVQDNHRLLVIIAHGFIELLVSTLVKAKCKNASKLKNTRDFPHSAKLLILHELGHIDDFRYRSLDWFRGLRNSAAHEPLFEVNEEEWKDRYKQVTGDHVEKAEQVFNVTRFYDLCRMFVMTFWANHADVFGPVFFPKSLSVQPVLIVPKQQP